MFIYVHSAGLNQYRSITVPNLFAAGFQTSISSFTPTLVLIKMAQKSVLVSPHVRREYLHFLTTSQITGANGHLGFRALVSSLEAGYKVRAVVRREAAAEQIKAAKSTQPYLNQIEIVFIQDLLQEGAFDEAVIGMNFVLHIASPVSRPVS